MGETHKGGEMMKCPDCGRERFIPYELCFSVRQELGIGDEYPCLECLIRRARERNYDLELSDFHFLLPWIGEGHGATHQEIECLLRRLQNLGISQGEISGEVFVNELTTILWRFSGWLEETTHESKGD